MSNDMHGRIMRLKLDHESEAACTHYLAAKLGHRDARHAAAEIAAEGDSVIAELVAALEGCIRWFPSISNIGKMGLSTVIPLRDLECARAALARAKGQA